MSSPGSITRLVEAVQEGDQQAASRLWEKYFRRLAGLARKQLGDFRRHADEEDVVLSAFATFCRRAQQEEFVSCHDRDDFWRLLSLITKRKAINLVRHERARRRGGGTVRGQPIVEDAIDEGPTPAMVAELLDEMRHLLDALRREDQTLCLIAQRKFEGLNNEQIAAELSRSVRTVERKLERIRALWEEDLAKRSDVAAP